MCTIPEFTWMRKFIHSSRYNLIESPYFVLESHEIPKEIPPEIAANLRQDEVWPIPQRGVHRVPASATANLDQRDDDKRFSEVQSVILLVVRYKYWLVVSTPLKNFSQLGWLFPIYAKIKNVPNHQPELLLQQSTIILNGRSYHLQPHRRSTETFSWEAIRGAMQHPTATTCNYNLEWSTMAGSKFWTECKRTNHLMPRIQSTQVFTPF